ncbi:hypothetical protein CEXT_184351 [Caerostris extrusa]|uniref:Uncharacterized protein n=1 Tax=Caerostris extrusa TaxID=172846 RepID=A0AAV4N5W2_CAEEX|nr:hypothetical protein CEXT_184351 [Caerostris extrusa]
MGFDTQFEILKFKTIASNRPSFGQQKKIAMRETLITREIFVVSLKRLNVMIHALIAIVFSLLCKNANIGSDVVDSNRFNSFVKGSSSLAGAGG